MGSERGTIRAYTGPARIGPVPAVGQHTDEIMGPYLEGESE